MKETLFALRTLIILILVFASLAHRAQAGADLVVESIEFSNFSILGSEGRVRVDYCVQNIGTSQPSESSLVLYASSDSTITSSDHKLFATSYGSMPSVPPGETYCWGRTVQLGDLPRGDYYIGALVRWGSPPDWSTSSNSTSEMFSLPAAPDLIVQYIESESGSFRPGESVSISNIVVVNTGYGPADSYTIDYYASVDAEITPGDYQIGSQTRGPVAMGGEDSFGYSGQFPDDMPGDDYYIGAIVTCAEEAYHPDNNTGVNSDHTVWVGSSADLDVQSVQVTPGAHAPDETFVVYSLIENIGGIDSGKYAVEYYASKDTTITKNDFLIGSIERGNLAPGEKDSCETTYRIPFSIPAGRYYIGIIVSSKDEYDPANSVGRSTATIELVHPSGYVCGNVQYVQSEYYSSSKQAYLNRTLPIRYAIVQVFEDDNNKNPLDDRLVKQTHTDPNGNYEIILPNDENRAYNIYVKVLAEGASGAYPETTSKMCILKDDVFKETYACVSTVYPHPRDASVVINLTAPGKADGDGEFMVFDSLVEGFIKAKTFLHIELGEISAYWPCEDGGTYFDPCETEMGIYVSQYDRRDRDVIMHEYGHYVAYMYGVGQGPVGENSMHYWNRDLRYEPVSRTNEHAMNLAFREAWASVFSIATQYGDTTYPTSGDSKYIDVDEQGSWTLGIDLDNVGSTDFSPGQYYENMNAGVLWDIFDDKNDGVDGRDTLSDPSLSKIWAILQDYRVESIVDFWNNWFLDYDHEAEMKYIFETHEMPFVKPGQ